MNASARIWFRIFLVGALIFGFYGGLGLLTVMMFLEGHLLIGVVTGLVLAVSVVGALALLGVAWSMSCLEDAEEPQFGLAPQPA